MIRQYPLLSLSFAQGARRAAAWFICGIALTGAPTSGGEPGTQGVVEISLGEDMSAALSRLAREHQLTINTLVQGAWALLLSRYSGAQDVLFGATVSGRPADLPGAEQMIGLFINTLPVRVQVAERMRLGAWLQELQASQSDLRQYEYTPLVQIQEWSEVPGGRSLFDSILVFENYELDAYLRTLGERWQARDFELLEQANYPLALSAWAGPELLLKIAYDQRKFDGHGIARALGHLKTLLEGMAERPFERLISLPMLTDQERRQLIFEWNDTRRRYPKHVCVHQLFEAQVNETPEATAITFERECVSYGELNRRMKARFKFLLQDIGLPKLMELVAEERMALKVQSYHT